MPDSCDQRRGQIRALQGERRSLESKLMQPQVMLAASLVERFLRAGGSPRTAQRTTCPAPSTAVRS